MDYKSVQFAIAIYEEITMRKSVKSAVVMGLTAMSLSLPSWAAAADYRIVENGSDPV